MPTDKEIADAARKLYAARMEAYETFEDEDWLKARRKKRVLYEILEVDWVLRKGLTDENVGGSV